MLQALLGRQIVFGRGLMLKLPIMKLFIFSILVFLSTEKQFVALWEFLHAPKDRVLIPSIYASTLKDLALLVCCQSNISFSELCKSTLKFIAFFKLIFK